MNGAAGGRPIIYLVARREVLMRLRSWVFTPGAVAIIVLHDTIWSRVRDWSGSVGYGVGHR